MIDLIPVEQVGGKDIFMIERFDRSHDPVKNAYARSATVGNALLSCNRFGLAYGNALDIIEDVVESASNWKKAFDWEIPICDCLRLIIWRV